MLKNKPEDIVKVSRTEGVEIMKKAWLIMIVIGMVYLGTGCNVKEGNETLHVVTEASFEEDVMEAKSFFQIEHPEIQIEVQVLKQDREERTSEIQKIRTEIMAGNGPDVFLLGCADELISEEDQQECLFSNVNKAMESGGFAALDTYMQKDEYWEHDTYQPAILKAGQYKGRQYVIPLGCTYFIYAHPETEDVLTGTTLEDWLEEITESENEELKYQMFRTLYRLMCGRIIQPAIDYENCEVQFDKAAWASVLRKYIPEYQNVCEQEAASELKGTSEVMIQRADMLTLSEETDLQCQAVPELTGNRTAAITSFGAVGMSSENPEMAYEFLMLFLNDKMESEEFGTIYGWISSMGVPVQERSWKKYLESHGMIEESNQQAILESFWELDNAYFPLETECELYQEIFEILNSAEKQDSEDLGIKLELVSEEYEKQYQAIAKE